MANAAFHYIVRARLMIYKNPDEVDSFEFEKIFKDVNPIVARDNAFSEYQNYVDVLLQSKGLTYETDKQAKEALISFVETNSVTKINFYGKEYEFNNSIGKGIGVYFKIVQPKDSFDTENDELLIHGFEKNINSYHYSNQMVALQTEMEYYDFYKYDTGGQIVSVTFCDQNEWEEGYRENQPERCRILRTPVDWSEMGEPYWWGAEEEVDEVPTAEMNKWKAIIAQGEGRYIEFKSTLRYNLHQKKIDKAMEHEVAKTIAAFSNSEGGILLIGVDDDNGVLGLEADFSLYGRQKKDNFYKSFKNLVETYLGLGIAANLDYDFIVVDDKDLFVIEIFESKVPVYLNNLGKPEFFVRVATSSINYNVQDAVNYVLDHWKYR